jgi:hypothetical protein
VLPIGQGNAQAMVYLVYIHYINDLKIAISEYSSAIDDQLNLIYSICTDTS